MYYKKFLNKFKENEILRKSFSALILRVLGMFFAYCFLIIVTQSYGAEIWGTFAFCLAILNISSIISRCGIDTSLIKLVAINSESRRKIRGLYIQSVYIVILVSFILSLVIYFGSEYIASVVFLKPDLCSYIRIISYLILPYSLLSLNAAIFRGLKNIRVFTFFKFTTNFIFAIVIFLVISRMQSYSAFFENKLPIYAFFMGIIISFIISSIAIYRLLDGLGQHVKIIKAQSLLKLSLPMMIAGTTLLLMTWVDTIMIGRLLSMSDVGVYNIAMKLAFLVSLVLVAVGSILAPKIAESYNNNNLEESIMIKRSAVKIIFFSSLPVLLLLALFPEFFLSFFGAEFIVAKSSLLILLIGQSITSILGPVGLILQMIGKEILFHRIVLFALTLNIALNYLLIPIFGIMGAAIASTLSLMVWNFIAYINLEKLLIYKNESEKVL